MPTADRQRWPRSVALAWTRFANWKSKDGLRCRYFVARFGFTWVELCTMWGSLAATNLGYGHTLNPTNSICQSQHLQVSSLPVGQSRQKRTNWSHQSTPSPKSGCVPYLCHLPARRSQLRQQRFGWTPETSSPVRLRWSDRKWLRRRFDVLRGIKEIADVIKHKKFK